MPKIIVDKSVNVNVHKNILTNTECEKLINIIKQKHKKAKLTIDEPDFFSGRLAYFDIKDLEIFEIEKRLSELVGLPINTGEHMIGMYFKEGQYFKLHTDYFELDEHINCSKDLKEFESKSELQIYKSAELKLPKYNRFMIVGYK